MGPPFFKYHQSFNRVLSELQGLGLLTFSAMLLTPNQTNKVTSSNQLQVILFFISLYLVGIGQSGHKPCVQAFGADQFDGLDPEECKMKSSFFNWWYAGLCFGVLLAYLILYYIEDNFSWALGCGIPCIAMFVGLIVFLLGTKTYRYSVKRDERSPFARIGRVFFLATKNRLTRLQDDNEPFK